jgi:GR25 family glycosyltransferase involved in LPS biosynthesis
VVSAGTSWRLNGLREAAQLTGIDYDTPIQPDWSENDVDHFRGIHDASRNAKIGPGETRAWLGHLNAIQDMIAREDSTALFMEDDVDWDILLKQQLVRVAPLIRQVSGSSSFNRSQLSPYGDAWDMLWLGHCYDRIPYIIPASYIDDTLPDSSVYFENDGTYTNFPQYLRMVYMSEAPACMYAYALTARSARRVYNLAKGGMDRDISFHFKKWCQAGILRCVTVNPELFHHHKQAGERSSEVAVLQGWQNESLLVRHSFTSNIKYSARCNSKSEQLVQCQFLDGK